MASGLALFSTKRNNWCKLRLPNFCIRYHWSASHEFRMFLSSKFGESGIVDHGKVVSPHDGTRRRIQHDEIYHLMQLLWPCFRRSYCGGAPVRIANELGVWSVIALPAECWHFPVWPRLRVPDSKTSISLKRIQGVLIFFCSWRDKRYVPICRSLHEREGESCCTVDT